MPVSSKDQPEKLRPYLFHRVDLSYQGTSDAIGTCPFCGKEQKFFVSQSTGLYHCKTCTDPDTNKSGGNVYTFLRRLHKESLNIATEDELEEVAENRRTPVEALIRWGLVASCIDREWILPSHGNNNEINNLYRWSWSKSKKGTKRRLMTTATLEHSMFNLHNWDQEKPDAYITEGPWDGIAFEDKLMKFKQVGTSLVRTGKIAESIFASTNVVAVPGSETFKDSWGPRFKGKNVALLYDNDYPRTHPKTGAIIAPAGLTGMKATVKKLLPYAKTISVINWGEEGYDPTLEDGFDIRDFLSQ